MSERMYNSPKTRKLGAGGLIFLAAASAAGCSSPDYYKGMAESRTNTMAYRLGDKAMEVARGHDDTPAFDKAESKLEGIKVPEIKKRFENQLDGIEGDSALRLANIGDMIAAENRLDVYIDNPLIKRSLERQVDLMEGDSAVSLAIDGQLPAAQSMLDLVEDPTIRDYFTELVPGSK